MAVNYRNAHSSKTPPNFRKNSVWECANIQRFQIILSLARSHKGVDNKSTVKNFALYQFIQQCKRERPGRSAVWKLLTRQFSPAPSVTNCLAPKHSTPAALYLARARDKNLVLLPSPRADSTGPWRLNPDYHCRVARESI